MTELNPKPQNRQNQENQKTSAFDAQLHNVFMKVFDLSESEMNSDLALGTCPNWDSLGHMNLITALEAEFEVRFDSEDIPELKTLGLIRKRLEEIRN